MASPPQTGKRSVDLKAPGVRVSRIRRDPPPKPVKEMSISERDERNQRMVVIGVLAFAAAFFIIIIGFSSAVGWSPSQYIIEADL